jgi:hypothetical protein
VLCDGDQLAHTSTIEAHDRCLALREDRTERPAQRAGAPAVERNATVELTYANDPARDRGIEDAYPVTDGCEVRLGGRAGAASRGDAGTPPRAQSQAAARQ